MRKFDGKVIVITGGGGGIETAHAEVLSAHGGADVLVNNAGLTVFSSLEELEEEEVDRLLAVNLRAVIDGCRVFLPSLRARPEAHIINTASSASFVGIPWQALYSATKFAVRGFSLALRAELASTGRGVTCICPGATATDIIPSAGSRSPAVTDAMAKHMTRASPPARLAKRVVRAVRHNRAVLPIPPAGHLFALSARLFPGLMRASMRAVACSSWRPEAFENKGPGPSGCAP